MPCRCLIIRVQPHPILALSEDLLTGLSDQRILTTNPDEPGFCSRHFDRMTKEMAERAEIHSATVAQPARATPLKWYPTLSMFFQMNCHAVGLNLWLVRSMNLS